MDDVIMTGRPRRQQGRQTAAAAAERPHQAKQFYVGFIEERGKGGSGKKEGKETGRGREVLLPYIW